MLKYRYSFLYREENVSFFLWHQKKKINVGNYFIKWQLFQNLIQLLKRMIEFNRIFLVD